MIDWDVAVTTGVRLVRPGPQVEFTEARHAVTQLRELSVAAQAHVRDFTEMHSLEPAGAAVVVDRPGWIRANVDGFRAVLEPLLDQLGTDRLNSSAASTLTSAVGSRITGVQLGAVLSYLAGRVLGQYELFLPPDPDGRAPAGRLTLVAPNIVQAERELDVNPDDFRLWVCLHEETHRTQFTSVPWLRDYVQEQMREFLLASEIDAGAFLDRLRATGEAVAEVMRGGDATLIDALQTPGQSEVLERVTAVMTLAEGHGDYVMDAVGPEVVPSVAEIRERFQRRREGTGRIDRVIRQLLGIELKMRQYAEGSAFVRQVIDQVGMREFNRVWESPQTLPTMAEIREPQSWIQRVVHGQDSVTGADDSTTGEGPAAASSA
ncbi:zinc-dependent metalloprotease [Lipingzhangella sp. LS1_29]|uniref:Zinc-dependent metalloprotease n=1 Tax=Lipingzhangella rawalii TaxID=2055835 RepID=A0ABU2H4N8_9ACTN|nr:zinc-dependent metalloprotease [Lipingzhangella rawalii]MDS1270261.1 zinc-dependent metalloprotease [Lipingzhangella rawalii]